jgi:hypothetical protein
MHFAAAAQVLLQFELQLPAVNFQLLALCARVETFNLSENELEASD